MPHAVRDKDVHFFAVLPLGFFLLADFPGSEEGGTGFICLREDSSGVWFKAFNWRLFERACVGITSLSFI